MTVQQRLQDAVEPFDRFAQVRVLVEDKREGFLDGQGKEVVEKRLEIAEAQGWETEDLGYEGGEALEVVLLGGLLAFVINAAAVGCRQRLLDELAFAHASAPVHEYGALAVRFDFTLNAGELTLTTKEIHTRSFPTRFQPSKSLMI